MVPLWLSRGLRPCSLRIWHWFFDPTFGRSCVVYRCATLWVYEIPWGIGYDSCRSQRELPEYTKITTPHCPEKSFTFMWSKILFFFLWLEKGTLVRSKIEPYITVIQLVKGYQNHHLMTLHDLPFVKKWVVDKSIFQILGIFRV